MPAFTASAPGKIILFGEHAVVYGQPAIAVPVTQVRATATIRPNLGGKWGEVRIQAPDIGLDTNLQRLDPAHPICEAVNQVTAALGADHIPACTLRVRATIPIASGLGSGAAISVAIIRALSGFLGHPLPNETVSALAYEVEKIHHGTPSGIDNTVVTYAQPVYFVKEQAIQTFEIAAPFTIVIGDTGIPSPTKESVGDVRQSWQRDPARYERFFAAAGQIAQTARKAIESGHVQQLGQLMRQNHAILQQVGVSCPELDQLVDAAQQAGAWGAKLSGGGRGGNMIALTDPEQAPAIAAALSAAGATNTIITNLQ